MEETVELTFDGLENKKPLKIMCKRPIVEYTLDGKFVKVHNSIVEASYATNVSTSAVTACCSGNVLTSKKAKRIFLYADDDISERLRKVAENVPSISPLYSVTTTLIREYNTEGILLKTWPNILSVSKAFNVPFRRIKRHLEGSDTPIKGRFFLKGTEEITERLAAWKLKEQQKLEKESLIHCAEMVAQINVYTSSGEFLRTCKNSSEAAKIYGMSINDVNNHMSGKAMVTRGLIFLPYGETIQERLDRIKNRKTWKRNL